MNKKKTKINNNGKKPNHSPDVLLANERVKLKYKSLKIVTYKLPNGETTITLRQADVAVKKPPLNVKRFLKKIGEQLREVKMPNQCTTDMITLSAVAQYWRYLNCSKQGNLLTELGEELLADYLPNSTSDTK